MDLSVDQTRSTNAYIKVSYVVCSSVGSILENVTIIYGSIEEWQVAIEEILEEDPAEHVGLEVVQENELHQVAVLGDGLNGGKNQGTWK